ncbi:DUF3293 domain-containing protein [Caenimonas koreensis]|uniref:DUF3293 domain-containing protein n=1 Tax=Caenimonas koreensis TaxID=367474 RepID=UPI0037836D2A
MTRTLRQYPPPSPPPSELIDSYFHADYVTQGITLRLDAPTPDLNTWLAANNCTRAILITGWNPFSQELPLAENEQRNQALKRDLEERGLRVLDAVGRSRDAMAWEEPGYCVLECDEAVTDELLVRYSQYAAVVADKATGCSLVWHPSIRERLPIRASFS